MNEPTEAYLADLAARSSSLTERLMGALNHGDVSEDEQLISARVEAWCEAVAENDAERFHQRLAWDGLNIQGIKPALGSVQWRAGTPLPAWTATLETVIRHAAHESFDTNAHGFFDPATPLPFQDVLAPFVVVARQRLLSQSSALYSLLSFEAHTTLERHLLQVLVSYAAQALRLEFAVVKAREQSLLAQLFGGVDDPKESNLYRKFVQKLWTGGLVLFYREYTVLARLLSIITDRWVETTGELLQRLSSDRRDLQRMWNSSDDPGQVIAVEPSLSDPHCGRKSVIALTFEAGRKVIYKPRGLGVEDSYIQLLSWLNMRGAPLPFKLLRLINRGTYGWIEYVNHAPCQNEEEARRYFQRAGMLLCMVYALNGTDCHFENIVANGENPVLVDMEALLSHRADFDEQNMGNESYSLAFEQMTNSVLYTGLLPNWSMKPDHSVAYDGTGFGSTAGQETPFQSTSWEAVNSDHITIKRLPVATTSDRNVPTLGVTPLSLSAYGADVTEGFRQMYRFLVSQRDAIVAPHSPLYTLAQQQVRFLFRSTEVYWTVLLSMLNPKYLRDGVDQSIQCELLCRALISNSAKSRFWPIVAIEVESLQCADIPFFTARADSTTLHLGPERSIEDCFTKPGFECALARIRSLSTEDEEMQVAFIQGSLYAYAARDTTPEVSAKHPLGPSAEAELNGAAALLSSDDLVAHAITIAEAICDRTINGADGSATWIGPQYVPRVRRYALRPIGYSLYDGACGIALFFAALEKVVGDGRYRNVSLSAVRPLRRVLRTASESVASEMGIGGAMGLGSVIYTLTRMAGFLDEPALLQEAEQAAELITSDRVAADRSFDVMSGAAGAILGLLTLYTATSSQFVIERARACGRHLLRTRVTDSGGYRGWPNPDGIFLTGFAHGAAGIAYALSRLSFISSESTFLEAAGEAIAYEDSVFAPEAGNWPDYRQAQQPAFMRSWCAGAPGIGLARVGGLSMHGSSQIRRDIEIALLATQRVGNLDTLCCGNMGRAEFLLTASRSLSRPQLFDAAKSLAGQVVIQAKARHGFALHHSIPPGEGHNPGLFSGTAGIGYELLRISALDAIPSVLLWE